MGLDFGGVLGSGLDFIGNAVNAISTGVQNRKNRNFAKGMYERQKQDAIDFWNMQNAYNSPEQQMQRLRSANLNPNLMYGKGTVGNSESINVPSQAHFSGVAPQLGSLSGVVSDYFNIRGKQLVNNNLGAQNDVLRAEANLKEAQKLATTTSAARAAFDLGLHKEARQSLLTVLNSSGHIANATANLRDFQAFNAMTEGDILNQKFSFLDKLNPRQLAALDATVTNLQDKHQLNEKALEAAIKNNRLIGVSDKTEIGSLVRALLTLFNQDPSKWFGK